MMLQIKIIKQQLFQICSQDKIYNLRLKFLTVK